MRRLLCVWYQERVWNCSVSISSRTAGPLLQREVRPARCKETGDQSCFQWG